VRFTQPILDRVPRPHSSGGETFLQKANPALQSSQSVAKISGTAEPTVKPAAEPTTSFSPKMASINKVVSTATDAEAEAEVKVKFESQMPVFDMSKLMEEGTATAMTNLIKKFDSVVAEKLVNVAQSVVPVQSIEDTNIISPDIAIHENNQESSQSKAFVCGVCEKQLTSEAEFERHIRVMVHFLYKCGICSTGYTLLEDLKEHQEALKHFDLISTVISEPAQSLTSAMRKMSIAPTKVQTSDALQSMGASKYAPGNATTQATANNTLYTCKACSMNFDDLETMENHYEETGHMGYFCTICGTRSSRAVEAAAHYRKHDRQLPKFQCPTCQLMFKSREAADGHTVVTKHEAVICPDCSKPLPIGVVHEHNPNLQSLGTRQRAGCPVTFRCLKCSRSFDDISTITAHQALWGHSRDGNRAQKQLAAPTKAINPAKCGRNVSIHLATAIEEACAHAKSNPYRLWPMTIAHIRENMTATNYDDSRIDAREIIQEAVKLTMSGGVANIPDAFDENLCEDSDEEDEDNALPPESSTTRLAASDDLEEFIPSPRKNHTEELFAALDYDLMNFENYSGPVLPSDVLIPINHQGRSMTFEEVQCEIALSQRPDYVWTPMSADDYNELLSLNAHPTFNLKPVPILAPKPPQSANNLTEARKISLDGDVSLQSSSFLQELESIDLSHDSSHFNDINLDNSSVVALSKASHVADSSLGSSSTVSIPSSGHFKDSSRETGTTLDISSIDSSMVVVPNSDEWIHVKMEDQKEVPVPTPPVILVFDTPDPPLHLACSLCEKTFKTHSLLAWHMESGFCTEAPDLTPGKLYGVIRTQDRTTQLFTFSRQIPRQLSEADGPLVCAYCKTGFKFSSLTDLNMHYKYEPHGAKLYACPGCDIRFKTLTELFEHIEDEEPARILAKFDKFSIWWTTGMESD
jgi:hypothetical protein